MSTKGTGKSAFIPYPSTEEQEEVRRLLSRRAQLTRKELAARGKIPAGFNAFRNSGRRPGRPPTEVWPAFQILAFTLARQLGLLKIDPDVALLERKGGFWPFTGPAPLLGPGDVLAARDYLHKLESARAMGGWGPSDRVMLCRLIGKWGRRASGKDARFQALGTAPGRQQFAKTGARK